MSGNMVVTDFQEAGRLFIKLAKRDVSIPENTVEAISLLQQHGIMIQGYEKVVFHTDTPQILNLVVRREDLITQTEQEIANPGSDYRFPSEVELIYRRYFTGAPGGEPTNQEVFRTRIGDYILGQCR